jgi:hypothetical protein
MPPRDATIRPGVSSSPTTRFRRYTGGSVTTRARASATAPTSTAPSRSTRSSGSWATSPARTAGRSPRRRPVRAGACWSSARDRAGCRPPITWRAAGTTSRSATPSTAVATRPSTPPARGPR